MRTQKPYLSFIIDPLENFNPEGETTLFMMKEAQSRGYGIFCAQLPNLYCEGNEVWAQGQEIEILGIGKKPFYKEKQSLKLNLAETAAVLLRKDPPFDLSYLHHLYLLAQLRGRIYLMNDPVGVMAISEKVFPLWFSEYIPQTCITKSWEEASRFLKTQKKGSILKPLNSSGGRGVFYLKPHDSNTKVAFETLGQEGREYVICQEYLPAVQKGDKRILLLGGEILGYFARVPAKGSHRANLHSGGHMKACKLNAEEIKIAEFVGRVLQGWGIDFAGIDLIGGKLTEVNVTSPMGIREINAMQKIKAEKKFMDLLEERIGRKNASKN